MKIRRFTAVIIIAVLAVALGAMVFINARRSRSEKAEYQAAVLADLEKSQAREAERYAKEARENDAYQSVIDAAQSYIPGVIFYDDMISAEENVMDLSYPTIIRTLMLKNIYDIPIGVSDMNLSEKTIEDNTWLPVVFVGMDGSWDGDPQSLIKRQKEIIGMRNRYIVLGLYTGDSRSRADLEAAMTAEYGDKYINLREYFSTSGMESLGMQIDSEDRAAMAQGETPPGLMSGDGIHLNSAGYKLVAFLTYDRMTSLGYFDEIVSATEIYYAEKNKH